MIDPHRSEPERDDDLDAIRQGVVDDMLHLGVALCSSLDSIARPTHVPTIPIKASPIRGRCARIEIVAEISSAGSALWQEYTRLSKAGLRREALITLDRFLEAMRGEPATARARWVLEFLVAHAEVDVDLLRFPLFRDLIFPILRDRFRNRDGEAAYWLAMCTQQLYKADALWKEIDRVDQIDLLERALLWKPDHSGARRSLVDALARAFQTSVHEVPSGVLGFRSMDGASVEECDELLSRLDRFETLTRSEGQENAFIERIAEWRFQFRSYRSYLLDKEGTRSYADYLSARRSM